MSHESRREGRNKPPSRWQVFKSVAAAAFGVQTQAARERDFTQGQAAPFIIGAIVFTVLFVIVLVVVVQVVLSVAGV